MKVTVDVDCSPEEARRFLGLPDLSVVHDAYIAKMRKAVEDGSTADMLAEMMRNWTPISEAGTNLWKQMFEQMSGKR